MRHLRVVVLAAVLVALFGTVAGAQSNVVTINPLGFIFGVYNASYETAVSNSASVQVEGQYLSWDLGFGEVSGVGVGASLRYYPGQLAPHGFYVGPGATVAFVSATSEDLWTGETTTETATVFGAYGTAGYQWIGGGGFAVNLAANVTMMFGGLEGPSGISPGLSFGIGYGW